MTVELARLIAAAVVVLYNVGVVFPLHTGRPRGPLV
jgi:hypothetical protein